MIEKTRGIFLHAIKYSETSLITSIYTENFGRQSYMISGVRNKKSSVKSAVFQPLYLLDLEVYYKSGREIHRLKDARISYPYSSIPFDIRKSSQVIFLAEILYKCIREEEPNPELFEFIYHSLTLLDLSDSGVSNFHLWFLYKLTRFLGIYPNQENVNDGQFFDLQKAQFVGREPFHNQFADKQDTQLFAKLVRSDSGTLGGLDYTQHERNQLLKMLIEFYRIHFDQLSELRSIAVLKEVFR